MAINIPVKRELYGHSVKDMQDLIHWERKKEAEQNLYEAMQLGKAKEWEALTEKGMEHPENMERLCHAFYRHLPELYKYLLPVKWYMHGGRIADSVKDALSMALRYRPEDWIGQEEIKGNRKKGIDVYCGARCSIEEAPSQISWTTREGAAQTQAYIVGGRVFKAYLPTECIIAIDKERVDNILQYNSVLGIEQIFPKISATLM